MVVSTVIPTMLPTEDSVVVAEELGRRFGLPLWQFTLSATDAAWTVGEGPTVKGPIRALLMLVMAGTYFSTALARLMAA